MSSSMPATVFISYSRVDSQFVDRLEAELRVRGLEVWVDRRRLEGGQDWEREIHAALDQFATVVVVLSPDAVASPAVAQEYTYAIDNGKHIIPFGYRPCVLPALLGKYQVQPFEDNAFERSVKDLIYRILAPNDRLHIDSRELYAQALAAKGRGDLEQAAVLLQRIVDRESDPLHGPAAADLTALNDQLYSARAQHLRQDAMAARRAGEYGREAGALEALLALGKSDAWAAEYLPVAQRNRQFVDLYAVIQGLMDAGGVADARTRLTQVWQKAPYYGDPAGIAPRLGLEVPPSYEQVREQDATTERMQQAERTEQHRREQAEQAADEKAARAESNEEAKWRAVQATLSSSDSESVMRAELRNWEGAGAGEQPSIPLGDLARTRIQLVSAERTVEARRQGDRSNSTVSDFVGSKTMKVFFKIAGSVIVLALVCGACSSQFGHFVSISPSLFWLLAAAVVVIPLVVAVPYIVVRNSRSNVKLGHAEAHAINLRTKARNWYQQWLQSAQPTHEARLRQFQESRTQRLAEVTNVSVACVAELRQAGDSRLRDIASLFAGWQVPIGDAEVRQLADGRATYDRQLAGIGARHEQALDGIARRYGA